MKGESMSKIDEEMNKGGLLFWVTLALSAVALYGILWVTMALGLALGLQ